MEFNEKLQELRKQKGLTQEQLAQSLFVSRTAISKWESGRGYPNIDSLKAIAKLFSISIDDLLSSEELLNVAEADRKVQENHLRDVSFGLLDLCAALLFILPIFGQTVGGKILSVTLFSVTELSRYLKFAYIDCLSSMVFCGILILALQNCSRVFWVNAKHKISLFINIYGVILFVLSRQPYPAILLLGFLITKAFLLMKKR